MRRSLRYQAFDLSSGSLKAFFCSNRSSRRSSRRMSSGSSSCTMSLVAWRKVSPTLSRKTRLASCGYFGLGRKLIKRSVRASPSGTECRLRNCKKPTGALQRSSPGNRTQGRSERNGVGDVPLHLRRREQWMTSCLPSVSVTSVTQSEKSGMYRPGCSSVRSSLARYWRYGYRSYSVPCIPKIQGGSPSGKALRDDDGDTERGKDDPLSLSVLAGWRPNGSR